MDKFLGIFKELVIYFRNKIPGSHYQKACDYLHVKCIQLTLNMDIRWNSTFMCYSKLLPNLKNNVIKTALNYCHDDKEIKNSQIPKFPDQKSIEILEELLNLLEKFDFVTKKFEGIKNHCISHVYIGLYVLIEYCSTWKNKSNVKKDKTLLETITNLENNLKEKITEFPLTHLIACYFNPKSRDKLSPKQVKDVKDFIKEYYELEVLHSSSEDDMEKEMNEIFEANTN